MNRGSRLPLGFSHPFSFRWQRFMNHELEIEHRIMSDDQGVLHRDRKPGGAIAARCGRGWLASDSICKRKKAGAPGAFLDERSGSVYRPDSRTSRIFCGRNRVLRSTLGPRGDGIPAQGLDQAMRHPGMEKPFPIRNWRVASEILRLRERWDWPTAPTRFPS